MFSCTKNLHSRFFYVSSFILATLFLIQSTPAKAGGINPADVEIVRDKWGVPHIYGKTDADATYGLAWATCEDDFATVQRMLLAVNGRLAEVDGKGGAILDMLSFIGASQEVVDTAYDNALSPAYKKIVEAYAQGLNEYAAKHPEELLRPGLFPITPKDVIAQYVLTNMLLTDAYIDIMKVFSGYIKNYETNLPSGSNAFAFNSKRTEDGQTYLAVNSHQPLEGLFSWYEAHLVSGEGLNILGGTFPGGMSVFHGTNENLGWACTLNHPDLSDTYKLQMNPKNKLQYWFDDHWETLQVRKKTVKVKLGAIRIPITKTFYWSKYGTTIKGKTGVYAIRFPANMDITGCEKLYRMNKAKTFTEWNNVMSSGAFPGINFVFADRNDTIFYVSNAFLPYRNPKYDWLNVLPGNTSETLWEKKFHPYSELPQVLNPASGYLLNTNNSCFDASCGADNCKQQNYDPTFGFMQEHNNRSIMAHFLISFEDKVSYTDFKRIKYNLEYNDSIYSYGLTNARLMFELDPKKYPDIADAIATINQWNCVADVNNRYAALPILAIYPLIDKITGRGTQYEINSFTEKEYVWALRKAKKEMLKHFGSLTVPLGEVQKHVRGDKELPIGGMPDVIAANMTQPYKKGMRKTFVGESYIMLLRYSKQGVQIETVHAFGASAKAGSKHYNDQMEMFVNQQTKPMTLDRGKIYEEAESIYHPGIDPANSKNSAGVQ